MSLKRIRIAEPDSSAHANDVAISISVVQVMIPIAERAQGESGQPIEFKVVEKRP